MMASVHVTAEGTLIKPEDGIIVHTQLNATLTLA